MNEFQLDLSGGEREIIFLQAIFESLNTMANYEMIDLLSPTENSEIRFKTMTHRDYFSVLLVDFLSPPDKDLFGENASLLSVLESIVQKPEFDFDNSIDDLNKVVVDFSAWLECEVRFEKLWLPSINHEANILVKRIDFIKICGDISKHNFTRLTWKAKKIKNIFKKNEIAIDIEDSIVVLDDFYDFFHRNILIYHSSTLLEFLNNIRWGIYAYLQPQHSKSFVALPTIGDGGYKYTIPSSIKGKLAIESYWNLMNLVRKEPYMPRFSVGEYLKKRY